MLGVTGGCVTVFLRICYEIRHEESNGTSGKLFVSRLLKLFYVLHILR